MALEPVYLTIVPAEGSGWEAKAVVRELAELLEGIPEVHVTDLAYSMDLKADPRKLLLWGVLITCDYTPLRLKVTVQKLADSTWKFDLRGKGTPLQRIAEVLPPLADNLGLGAPAPVVSAPQAERLFELVGRARYSSEPLDKRLGLARLALDLDAQYPPALEAYGILLAQSNAKAEAVRALEKAFELTPSASVACALSALYREKGLVTKAESVLCRAMASNPKSPRPALALAELVRMRGDRRTAIELYRKAIAADPFCPDARLLLADALFEQYNMTDALRQYEFAAGLKPDLPPAHNGIGSVLEKRGKHQEALIHFRRAVELDPKYASALINLASSLEAVGKRDEAIQTLRNALELSPDTPELHNNLGWLYQKTGNIAAAREEYLKALSIDPADRVARANLEKLKSEERPGSGLFGFCAPVGSLPPPASPLFYLCELSAIVLVWLLRRLRPALDP